MVRHAILIVALCVGVVSTVSANIRGAPDPTQDPSPKWIWGPEPAQEHETRYFRIVFDANLPRELKTEDPSSAWIWAACDDEMLLYLNGKQIARHSGHGRAVLIDVRPHLVTGKNVIAARARNNMGPAAFALKLEIHRQYEPAFRLVTDETWQTTSDPPPRNWRSRSADDALFASARVIGDYGMEPYGQIPATPPARATPADALTILPGFKAELVYSVPRDLYGSWVCMTPDPQGRLYVSDQGGPLFRVTPGKDASETIVEEVPLDIGHAQGLLWAFDSLYVVVNRRHGAHVGGLYRLRDTTGDDVLDHVELLKSFYERDGTTPAHGEHGPHAVILGPDNHLYIVAGNFTALPDPIATDSPARNWDEDLLLERMPDAKGHANGIMAPGSWVCRTDPDGKTWQVIATGMRNAYDIAFSPLGELFTYDSDMEWDIGSPWYRPTRIYHLVSGAEIGWRHGSGKWPEYYPDSIPPVADIGLGSPTGVAFGTGAKFPAKYRRAFFASCWAYGKIYAVHLEPNGASYTATFEPFISGRPFDVTDICINTDGAMYVIIGGRGTQSGLYRISYVGDEPTDPVEPLDDPAAAHARSLRHKLESFHGHRDPTAVSVAWPFLNHDDRFLRFAARVAIEFQDPAEWTQRALSEQSPTALINALVALCRVGDESLQPRVLEALARLDLDSLTEAQLLEALRAYALCFIRMGEPDEKVAADVRTRLEPLFPHPSRDVTHELCQLLIYLNSPTVIEKSMQLLAQATTQEDQLFYVFHLRNVADGWTLEQRQHYFSWLNRAQHNYTGGASYKLFLRNVRQAAVKTLSDDEKVALASLLNPPAQQEQPEHHQGPPPRQFVRNWTMDDLLPKLGRVESDRSFERGKEAFAAVQCLACHRFNNEGGASGPDITGAGARFNPADLLETLILPSKVISDQYQNIEIITKDKRIFVGTIQSEDDQNVVVLPSPLSTHTETVLKADIVERRPSRISPMPEGLIDVLTEEEILDLLAYIRAAGDPNDNAFQK